MNQIDNKTKEGLQAYFEDLVLANKLSHAYAFTGVNDSLKYEIVTVIIQALVCKDIQDKDLAQQARLRVTNNHYTDILYLKPDGQAIKVDQIRELKEWLATSPVEGDFKLTVIQEAEAMNPSAANALLTFLEEPVDDVYILLLTPDISKLLPTIQSRVQEVTFPRTSLSFEAGIDSEIEIDPRHRHILNALPLEISRRWLDDYQLEEFQAWINQLNYFYKSLAFQDAMAFVMIQTHLKPFLSVRLGLDSLEYLWLLNYSMIKDRYLVKGESTIESFYIEELAKEQTVDQRHLLALDQIFLECKQRILANVSPQLAFEQLVICAMK